jgi:hypothetical protein
MQRIELNPGIHARVSDGGSAPPFALLERADMSAEVPLVVFGHGGSGHKLDPLVRRIAVPWVEAGLCRVVCVDGPCHGERHPAPEDSARVLGDFDRLWRSGEHRRAEVLRDWTGTIDWLRAQGMAPRRLGVYGLSMGTAYGLPWAAGRTDLDFAVFGMWGTAFPHSADLADHAARVAAPLLFVARHDDPLFPYPSQLALYDAFGSRERRLLAASGGHVAPDDAMLAYVNAFVRQHCAA